MMDKKKTLAELKRLFADLDIYMANDDFVAAEKTVLNMAHHFAIFNMSTAEYPYSPKNFEQYSAAEFTDPFFDPLEDDSRA